MRSSRHFHSNNWSHSLKTKPLHCTASLPKNYRTEYELVTITKLRTGTHNLHIETDRFKKNKVPREQRKCICDTAIQRAEHILLECPLLQHIKLGEITFTLYQTILTQHSSTLYSNQQAIYDILNHFDIVKIKNRKKSLIYWVWEREIQYYGLDKYIF